MYLFFSFHVALQVVLSLKLGMKSIRVASLPALQPTIINGFRVWRSESENQLPHLGIARVKYPDGQTLLTREAIMMTCGPLVPNVFLRNNACLCVTTSRIQLEAEFELYYK